MSDASKQFLHPADIERNLVRQSFRRGCKLRAQQFLDIVHAVDDRVPVREHALGHRLYAAVLLQIALERLHIVRVMLSVMLLQHGQHLPPYLR